MQLTNTTDYASSNNIDSLVIKNSDDVGNILLYFLSIIFILTGVLSDGFALESTRECGLMVIIGMRFGVIPDFIPFF